MVRHRIQAELATSLLEVNVMRKWQHPTSLDGNADVITQLKKKRETTPHLKFQQMMFVMMQLIIGQKKEKVVCEPDAVTVTRATQVHGAANVLCVNALHVQMPETATSIPCQVDVLDENVPNNMKYTLIH